MNASSRLADTQARAAMLQPLPLVLVTPEAAESALRPDGSPCRIDEALRDSFPASDPPSWTPGLYRPGPAAERRPDADAGIARRLLRRVAALF